MTYGVIDTLPVTGLLGVWRIGGLDYQVDAATRLDDEGGPYAVGQQVKVEYRLDVAGNRLAKEIERSNDDGGVSDPDHTKLVGYVGSMPPLGTFQGDWQIAGADFVADANTVFEEEHGLSLAVALVCGSRVQHPGRRERAAQSRDSRTSRRRRRQRHRRDRGHGQRSGSGRS